MSYALTYGLVNRFNFIDFICEISNPYHMGMQHMYA